ncbi:MAG TPA: carbamoyltransferase C-terminal domain-containing protein, partial [Pyrinomonadaceae bacterium]
NLKIKNRESFRPFAPAIQRERVSEFFALETDSPYMMLVAPVVESRQLPLSEGEQNLFGIEKLRVPRSDVPAVTHVDYSARVQTVNREGRRRFHHLLEVFRRRTGYPLLINTSFNVRDEPIVCTPADAYRCFMKTGMDHLVMHNFILNKAEQPKIAPGLTVAAAPGRAREKFKLVILGSSTAEGWPFHPLVDIGKLASYYLGEKIGGTDIEVVNLGKSGQPSREVVENLWAVPADADLVFLYCGHNEYWARYEYPSDLADPKRRMFDEHIAGRGTRRRILVEFRNNLEKIVKHFGRAGVPLIISTAAMNVCGRPPNRSVLRDRANEPKVRALLAEYASHRGRGDVAAALECVTAVLSYEPGLAIAHKHRGDCLRLKGQADEARRAYAKALGHDGFPTASTPEENLVAREVAAKHGLRLFDAEEVLAKEARDGLVDYDLMLDAVHPTLEGYAHLGRALAEMIQTIAGDRRPLPDFSEAELEAAFQLDTPRKVQAHLRVCLDLLHSSTMIWDGTEYHERAVEHVLRAAELDPENPEVLFHGFLAEAFRNRPDRAEDYLERALRASEVGTKRRIHPETLQDSLVMQQYIRRTKVGPLLDERGIGYGRGIASRIPIGYSMKAHTLLGGLCERIALPAVYYLLICPFGMPARGAWGEPFHAPPSEHSYWRPCGASLEMMIPAGNSGASYRRSLRLLVSRNRWFLVPPALALLSLGKVFRAKADKRLSPLIYALF